MTKKQHYMTEQERYKLEGLLAAKVKPSEAAKELGFTVQTIYNEIKRGTYMHTVGYKDVPRYSAAKGQDIFEKRQRNKGRPLKIGHDHEYAEFLDKKMKLERYSPAAALEEARRAGYTTRLSIQTIYNYIDKGFFLRMNNEDLWEKSKRSPRRVRTEPKVAHKDLPSIEKRPEWIGDHSVLGHWEGDLIVGCKGSTPVLLTLTERVMREEMIIKLPDRRAATIRQAFDRLERQMGKRAFREKFQSVTLDNGAEFMEYDRLVKSVFGGKRFDIWYTHAGAPYEKGANENHNRMIRRFLPKGTDFTRVTKKRIAEIQDWMNDYPRKSLGWLTPREVSTL